MLAGPDTTPDELIGNARSLGPMLREAGCQIDDARQLPAAIVEALRGAGCFRMSMPKAWKGCEADPLTQNRVIEEISAASGSAGWCVMIAAANAYFNAFLDQGVARAMYPDPDIVTAAAFAPPGRAFIAPGGLRVTGRWPFASGITHSQWVVGAVVVFDGDTPALDDSGNPRRTHVIARIEDAEVFDNWHTGGLRGSGSNDFAFNDLFVPEEHTFDIFGGRSKRPGPLWALNALFLANHPGVPLGIGRGAIDEFTTIIRTKRGKFGTAPKDQSSIQAALANAVALVESARAFAYGAIGSVWGTLVAGEEPGVEQRAKLRLSIVYAHDACARAVQELYHAAGSATVYTPNNLDRMFRDVHTACQHVIAARNVYEAAGKALLSDTLPPLW
jgi:alkylation response protein AidB-like acyl-CoA dehydrogenase